jgi:hypothetical protein
LKNTQLQKWGVLQQSQEGKYGVHKKVYWFKKEFFYVSFDDPLGFSWLLAGNKPPFFTMGLSHSLKEEFDYFNG